MNKLFTILIALMIFSCDKKVSIKVNIEDSTSDTDYITLQKKTSSQIEPIKKSQNKIDNLIGLNENKIIYNKYKLDSLKAELSNYKIAYNDFIIETIDIPPPEDVVEQKPNRPAIPEPVDDDTDDEEIQVYEDTDFNKFDEFDDDRETSKFIAFDEAPVAISGIKMKYPPMAKAAGIEGKVVVEFFIDKNGVVTEVEIVSGTGTVLDQAAVEAVKNSTWKPARQRTKKVGVWKKVPIKFSLD